MMVNYGNASGHVPPLELLRLARNSLTLARPGLSTHIGETEPMRAAAAELFDLVKAGVLKVGICKTYPLGEAAAAHRDVEARKYAGSVLLLP
jgi:NADPH2:quinone reductase